MPINRRIFLWSGAAAAILARTTTAAAQGSGLSPITNRWGSAKTTILDLDEVTVFHGRPGAAYSHHHQIVMHSGILFASWSNGFVGEDNPGQHMLFATSVDQGKSWSTERELTPPLPSPRSTYTAMGIRSYNEKLVAYYGHYAWTDLAYDENHNRIWPDVRDQPSKWLHSDVYTETRISDDGGATWGPPARILKNFVPNLRPFATSSGRLIVPGNISFPHTDDPVGVKGWKSVGIPRLPPWTVDDPEGFLKACGSRSDRLSYCEASFFQTDNGIIHMMLRTVPLAHEHHNGLLAVTESHDDGNTWSEPALTGYTDCSCRFHFGRLPDGRFFGLSCPDPTGGRSPLVLALSRDGVVFDEHFILGRYKPNKPRMPGNDKGGAYGYPTCDIADGTMYIVYSRAKEDIYSMRLPLRALSSDRVSGRQPSI